MVTPPGVDPGFPAWKAGVLAKRRRWGDNKKEKRVIFKEDTGRPLPGIINNQDSYEIRWTEARAEHYVP